MPIGLGIGVSHSPGMYLTTEEEWDALWDRLSLSPGVPQPAKVAEEKGEKLKNIMTRIAAGHAEITRQYEAYNPDVLIIIGGDQTEVFDSSNVPQFMFFLGEKGIGRRPGPALAAPGKASTLPPVELDIDVEFSEWLLGKLVKEENFDISFSYEMKNLGRHQGLPHAFVFPASYLLKRVNTPTVIVYENTYNAPSLSAKRCYDFGAALARVTKNDPRRIAILGSGGLSHDPRGKRSGWVDDRMDRWFLEQLALGNGKATQAMYTFDSDTMISGTGEVRAWITVTGAMEEMGSRAKVLDYIEAAKTVTGLGFAYWYAESKYMSVAAE